MFLVSFYIGLNSLKDSFLLNLDWLMFFYNGSRPINVWLREQAPLVVMVGSDSYLHTRCLAHL